MKRFQLVTEADARVLDVGCTIVLAAGGHVTPLARDTLNARRVSVVREGQDPDAADLAPVAAVRTVAVAGDHTALALKRAIVAHLRGQGIAAHDMGTLTSEPVDYPDTAVAAALAVARREADAGVVIDGTGLGSVIAANKVAGVRAALGSSQAIARYAREHAGANVIGFGATLVEIADALAILDVFLATPMREAQHVRRLAKVADIEQRSPR